MNRTASYPMMTLLLALMPAGSLMAAAPPALDPTSELAPPPFEITGPEDLGEAIEKARSIEHPDYKEKIRYQRTTHISFPLNKIESPDDMSRASIAGALGRLSKRTDGAMAPPPNWTPGTEYAEAPGTRTVPAEAPPMPAGLMDEGPTRGWSKLTIANH